ncbi:hypothetical protein ACFWSF_37640 [Streptomyces sp. NPDC058611]|uniref:hypothetical protein n=1 Tax=unclassified Streptomyces TaxID=2593676 RepID=UPI003662070E
MNIPVAVRWALLACASLNVFFALKALYRMHRSGPGHRTGPGLDALDHALGTVLIGTFLAGYPAVTFAALMLLGPVLLWQGVRDFRARREAKGRAPADAG